MASKSFLIKSNAHTYIHTEVWYILFLIVKKFRPESCGQHFLSLANTHIHHHIPSIKRLSTRQETSIYTQWQHYSNVLHNRTSKGLDNIIQYKYRCTQHLVRSAEETSSSFSYVLFSILLFFFKCFWNSCNEHHFFYAQLTILPMPFLLIFPLV